MIIVRDEKLDCPLDDKEKFSKLYDVIAEGFRSYTQNVVWTAGLLVGAIGWLLSSKPSRDFIQASNIAFLAAIIIPILIGILHTMVCYFYLNHSKKRVEFLEQNYEKLELLPYRDFLIEERVHSINLVLNWVLIAGFIALVFASR